MTTYQGGKKLIGKKIHDIILIIESNLSKEKLPYFEPFVGMAGVLQYFGKDTDRDVFATDINKDIILMWKAVQKGWKPPLKCSKRCYDELKKSNKHSAKRGFIGSAASWAGIFFHAYRLSYKTHRNYLQEGYNGIIKIQPYIKTVYFLKAEDYSNFSPKGFIIYCDPPYINNSLGNSTSIFRTFDHTKFWDIMRKWSKDNIVIISENQAPPDFKRIWCNSSMTTNKYMTKKYNDCLFIHINIYTKLDEVSLREIKNF